MANENLSKAKSAKNDEFYTQYADIEKEMNAYLDYDPKVFRGKVVLLPCDDPEWSNFTKYFAQNFDKLGLKKLISTSYAPDAKPKELNLQLSLFEQESPKFDKKKARANGRIFILERDRNGDKKTNFEDIEWDYLKGDGDFRSDEVRALRDQSDIIITNPPFSLFREFLTWIVEAKKSFVVLGNMNAITYKEVFGLIMSDKLWLGSSIHSGDREFEVPAALDTRSKSLRVDDDGKRFIRVDGIRWFTNLEHGRRHQPLQLMTKAENKKFSRHKEIKGVGYQKYDNYNAIEVPYSDAIPSDYVGIMGVPISFLSKYNPDQFEIVGMCENKDLYGLKTRKYSTTECRAAYQAKFGKAGTYDLNASGVVTIDGLKEKVYQRILIRHRKRKA
jgi:Adenine-specific methyltransferase EcoRI